MKEHPDFNPQEDRIVIRMTKEDFLEKKPMAISGQVTLGGIIHSVSYSEDGLYVILTPLDQIVRLN